MTVPRDRLECLDATTDAGGTGAAGSSPVANPGRLALASAMSLVILSSCMFFDQVDRCLDRGGRWNDATDACELQEQPGVEASVSGASSPTLLVSWEVE